MGSSRSSIAAFVLVAAGCSTDLWSTPDQRGQRAFDNGRFDEAAEQFRDPLRRGGALFRAGRFEEAAAAFGRTATAEGAFDRGNAQVFLGKYESAMESYDRALVLRPNWAVALENREIARVRLERLAPADDDAGGTGGQLEADDYVIDATKPADPGDAGEPIEVGDGDRVQDESLRALWLHRVETRPQDFLRAKFSYQLARQNSGESDE